jgi:hypothetical protein
MTQPELNLSKHHLGNNTPNRIRLMLPGGAFQRIRSLKSIGSGDRHSPPIVCPRTHDRNPPVSWAICKHVLDHCRHLALQLWVARVVHFHAHGHIQSVAQCYDANLFLMPGSRWHESYGVHLISNAYRRAPLVAANVHSRGSHSFDNLAISVQRRCRGKLSAEPALKSTVLTGRRTKEHTCSTLRRHNFPRHRRP